jgi:hypothetical protein
MLSEYRRVYFAQFITVRAAIRPARPSRPTFDKQAKRSRPCRSVRAWRLLVAQARIEAEGAKHLQHGMTEVARDQSKSSGSSRRAFSEHENAQIDLKSMEC